MKAVQQTVRREYVEQKRYLHILEREVEDAEVRLEQKRVSLIKVQRQVSEFEEFWKNNFPDEVLVEEENNNNEEQSV